MKKALKQLILQTYVILHKIYMSYTKYLFISWCYMSDELFEENSFQQFLPRNYLLTINVYNYVL